MDTIKGSVALQKAEVLSKAGGTFNLAFFAYSRTKKPGASSVPLKMFSGCTMRKPLPHDKFDIDGKNYFLFLTSDGQPRSCYRALIRAIGFSDEDNKLYRVKWYD
jgi:hypothetical protein